MNLLIIPLIISCFVMLVYYGYRDVKYREINILPLLIFCLISIIYLGLFIFKTNLFLWKLYFLQMIFTFIFVIIIFLLGKFSSFAYIGEGDLYVILMISFSCGFGILFPQIVFLVALLLMLLVPIFLFFTNLVKGDFPKYSFFKSILLLFLGVFKNTNKITDFYTPLEEFKFYNNKLIKNIKLAPNCDPDKELVMIKNIAKKNNIDKIWVSPLIPFIVPILISFVIVFLLFYFNLLSNFGFFMIPYI